MDFDNDIFVACIHHCNAQRSHNYVVMLINFEVDDGALYNTWNFNSGSTHN